MIQQGGEAGRVAAPLSPSRCTKCNSPPINSQCTNFILFDVALLPLHSKGLTGKSCYNDLKLINCYIGYICRLKAYIL